MAKKEEVKNEPIVSNLPMPISDNPLVIDLPDGQKLVVGKMESGSVIEVATWRGTGRPDSRTSRLMLGMSTGQADSATPAAKSPTSSQPSNEVNNDSVQQAAKKLSFNIPKLGTIAFKLPEINYSALKHLNFKVFYASLHKTRHKLVAKSKELAPVESVGELDIEKWLSNLKHEADKKVESSRALRTAPRAPKSVKKSAPVKKSVKKTAKKR
jgi:hypothetical protein